MQLWPFFTWLTAVVITLSALVSSGSPPLRRFQRQETSSRPTISKQQSDDVAKWMDITSEQILSNLHSKIERHGPGRRLKRAVLDPEVAMLTPEEEAEEERIANRVYEKMKSDGLLDDSELRPLIHAEVERYRINATEHNCGFPALSREPWDKYNSASHLHTNLLEMVKARNDNSHPHHLHSKDIGAWMWAKYAPSALSPNCYSSVPCEAPICMLIRSTGTREEERVAAFFIMKRLASRSQAHLQDMNAMKDAMAHVVPKLGQLVDDHTSIRHLAAAEKEVEHMLENYEIGKNRKAASRLHAWGKYVRKEQELYDAAYARAEKEKAEKLEEIESEYEPWKWVGNMVQTATILGGAIGGAVKPGKRDVMAAENAAFEPISMTMLGLGLATGVLNTVNFIVGMEEEEEKSQVTGGEAIGKPVFPPKPAPYMPKWRPRVSSKMGSIGGTWRDRADLINALERITADGFLYLKDTHNALFKHAFMGGKSKDEQFLLLDFKKDAFMDDRSVDLDTETMLRNSFIKAAFGTSINYHAPGGCKGYSLGPQSLKVCLQEEPNKVFFPYSFTTHMNLFDYPHRMWGVDNHSGHGFSLQVKDRNYDADPGGRVNGFDYGPTDYFDHPTSFPGGHLLQNYGFSYEDVVRESYLRWKANGGEDGGNRVTNRRPVRTSTDGQKAEAELRQNAFLFDIPIADCPGGECVSPINQPHRFNAPCFSGVKVWNAVDDPKNDRKIAHDSTEEFLVASGLDRHDHFPLVCLNKCWGHSCFLRSDWDDRFRFDGHSNPYLPISPAKSWKTWSQCNWHDKDKGELGEFNERPTPLQLAHWIVHNGTLGQTQHNLRRAFLPDMGDCRVPTHIDEEWIKNRKEWQKAHGEDGEPNGDWYRFGFFEENYHWDFFQPGGDPINSPEREKAEDARATEW